MLEVLEEMGLIGEAIAVPGVGCSSPLGALMEIDSIMTAHGRPPDVATAIKRILKYPLVFTIQGDGDCIAIGAGSLISAAIRGERITIVMLNNTNYGTTGGQMSPATMLHQRTTTTPSGREPELAGYPVHVAELLATFQGVAFTARSALNTPANFQRTKRYLKTAFEAQMEDKGLSFVEIIVACPPNWHLTPLESLKFIEEKVIPEFPLGEFKNIMKEGK
jgi:2-oxoglutarate ferredoxin oxidoreductase subunit beta